MDADGATDERADLRTAKSCGPDAPTLASSVAEVSARRRWQESPVAEESAEESVKTIARGMPGDSGVTVVTNACAYLTAHAATDAPSVRHSLRPCSLEGRNSCTTRARRAARSWARI